jgi:hypothetical protein
MAILFVPGVLLALAAPPLRGHNRAVALAAGAAMLIAFSVFAFIHPDLWGGEATVESNWRFALLTLCCEVPVLALALISLPDRRKAFWAGWIIHALFTLWLIVVVVWLAFFWHW